MIAEALKARKAINKKAVKHALKKHDFGKKNVPGKTGFNVVVANAKKHGYSKKVAQKIAGAEFQKIKAKGK